MSWTSWAPLAAAALLLLGAWAFYRRRFSYWRRRGAPGPQPTLVFGNVADALVRGKSFMTILRELYARHSHLPFVGIYMLHRPTLLVLDPELVRAVLAKDFVHFTDHGFDFNLRTQPLVNHLFNVNGARWRALRHKLSPAFSSSKMKYMFRVMADCGVEMQKYIRNDIDIGSVIDAKEIIARYSTDIIVSCAFGLDSNCFRYPNTEFRAMGKTVFEFDAKTNLAVMLSFMMPALSRKLDIPMLQKRLENFFITTVEDTVRYRTLNNYERNDLMQLLIRLMNNENIEDTQISEDSDDLESVEVSLTPLELAAQAFGFFIGGYETTSATSSFALYELCKNPEVQFRLRNEIDTVLDNHDGQLTYDSIMEMTYLDQVLEETLRLHPVAPQLIRVCTKDYRIPDSSVLIEKGTLVMIPIEALHRDPRYYENPDVFDPDNFGPENKAKRRHYTFLPFGEGPRMCIGVRFAMLVMKISLVTILKDFEVSLAGGEEALEMLSNTSLMNTPKHLYVQLTARS